MMNERIHRVLDGELPAESLPPAERAELDAFQSLVRDDGVPSAPAPDLSDGVMSRIDALERRTTAAGSVRRALGWLWSPRRLSVTLRPAHGLVAAAALVLVVWIPLGLLDRSPSAPEGVMAAGAPTVYVHFRLDAPGANRVELAGDFTEWEPSYELFQSQPGVWSVVVPLSPGVHDYAFVIDGQRWLADPLGEPVDDGFGGTNSRLSVLPPEGSRAS